MVIEMPRTRIISLFVLSAPASALSCSRTRGPSTLWHRWQSALVSVIKWWFIKCEKPLWPKANRCLSASCWTTLIFSSGNFHLLSGLGIGPFLPCTLFLDSEHSLPAAVCAFFWNIHTFCLWQNDILTATYTCLHFPRRSDISKTWKMKYFEDGQLSVVFMCFVCLLSCKNRMAWIVLVFDIICCKDDGCSMIVDFGKHLNWFKIVVLK